MATERTWIEANKINEEHARETILQIYCWVSTKDDKIILVSKDNSKWQFPGGHPEGKETHAQTLHRELKEEAGLDIENQSDNLKLFGYYLINEDRREYLQIRYRLDIPMRSSELTLSPQEKDEEKDKIIAVAAFSQDELLSAIPWLSDS